MNRFTQKHFTIVYDFHGKAAFDSNTSTSWRPQCPKQSGVQWAENEAWITFSTTEEAQYIIANELGHGSGGGNALNNGITVELKGCDGLRRIVMQPHNNNSASSEMLGITTDLSIIKLFRYSWLITLYDI